jgi:hypothetical protein
MISRVCLLKGKRIELSRSIRGEKLAGEKGEVVAIWLRLRCILSERRGETRFLLPRMLE